jgi:hypothetical protein
MNKRRRNWFSFSLRSLLLLITLGSVALVWWQRASRFLAISRNHAQIAQQSADTAWGMQRFDDFSDDANAQAQPFWEKSRQQTELSQQHRRAACFPFWKVSGEIPQGSD